MDSSIPLRRLIKKPAASALLARFQALLPELPLALVASNGQLFAGETSVAKVELDDLVSGLGRRGPVDETEAQFQSGNSLVRPLWIDGHMTGLILAGGTSESRPSIQQSNCW